MSKILILLSWFFGQVLGFENTPDSITPGRVENPPPLPCLSDVNIEMSAKQKENVQQENIPKEDVQKENVNQENVQQKDLQQEEVQKEDAYQKKMYRKKMYS